MSSVELVVVDDAEGAAQAAAERLAALARSGGHVALSGGSTPARAFRIAAELEPDWSGTELWWGDDRAVPPDDERSNYLLAERHLLAHVRTPPRAVHRIRGELGADAAAAEYERELAATALDLALQGLGPDGHTASLFPGTPSVEERARRVVAAVPGLEPWVERVTLTVPALCSARLVLYLVTGASKAEVAARAFAGPPDPAVPASLVRSSEGRTVAILDRAAAANLR